MSKRYGASSAFPLKEEKPKKQPVKKEKVVETKPLKIVEAPKEEVKEDTEDKS